MEGGFWEAPEEGPGYAPGTLAAALWAFARGRDFEEGMRLAVNLGGDADTVGAVYGQLDVLSNLTAEAYYQYQWIETRLNGVGSYFGGTYTPDFVGEGSRNLLISSGAYNPDGSINIAAVASRTGDIEPTDRGQWGAALHYLTDGGTDFGLCVEVTFGTRDWITAPCCQIFTVDDTASSSWRVSPSSSSSTRRTGSRLPRWSSAWSSVTRR